MAQSIPTKGMATAQGPSAAQLAGYHQRSREYTGFHPMSVSERIAGIGAVLGSVALPQRQR